MKRNEGKYEVVNKLPKGAQLVKEYAAASNVLPSALYNRLARGKAQFKIVIYYGQNFIVPI